MSALRERPARVVALVGMLAVVLAGSGCERRSDTVPSIPGGGHAGHAGHASHGDRVAADEIAFYTCSMHPSVKSADPGACPLCSMTLTPITRGEAASGMITIPPQRQQEIGVRTTTVERSPMRVELRAVGRVTYDERLLSDVTLKYRGWVRDLFVNTSGQYVEAGAPLFTLYSPELLAAQHELLTAVVSRRTAARTSAPARADYLVDAARERLRLWDLTEDQIDELIAEGRALTDVPILAPVSGHVVEKNVVAGSAIEPGTRMYRIAGLGSVWIEADVYEQDLGLVEVGQGARIDLPYTAEGTRRGQVAFVYPYLDDRTRTARVRIEVENRDLALKPDMYADVVFEIDLGPRLVVPEPAVLYAGSRRFVFVSLGDGKLEPRQIRLGRRSAELVEVVDGLDEGEVVVTSGNFLVAAESRLTLALEQWK